MAFDEPCLFSSLSLNGFRVSVHLGCSEEERRSPQWVRFDVRMRFSHVPKGCQTDRLEETLCYAKVSQMIRAVSERQEYNLVEKLTYDVFQNVRRSIPASVRLWVRATKEAPPIPDLVDGASFCLSDSTEDL